MAVGDVTQKKLLAKALNITASQNAITGAANKVTTITSITVYNSSSSAGCTVDIYAYGTSAANVIARISLAPLATEILTGLDYVLTAGESFYFGPSAANVINIAVMGIEEVVA
jgi:hypothetical protein